MFVSSYQFYYFLQSVFIGVISAFIYEAIYFVGLFAKVKLLRQIIDALFFVVPLYLYMLLSEIFAFPDFRLYMLIGVIFGFILEYTSFHKSLAKVFQMVYNKTISFIRRKNRDARKETKVNNGRYGNVCNTSFRSHSRFGLSAYRYRCKNKAKKRVNCRKNKT